MSNRASARSQSSAPRVEVEEPGRRAVRRPPSRHGPIAQLLMSLSPLSLILVVYAVADWVSAPLSGGSGTNRLGAVLHVDGPARADTWVFGAVPTVWLQARLVDGSAHWWDAVAALVYATHFVAIPLLTAFVWFRLRHRFVAWLVAVLTMSVVGIAGYVAYPAAPPWLASDQGRIGDVERISTIGWDVLHLGLLGDLTRTGQTGSNPVAAMPSLHAGAALLVALFLWPSVSRAVRAALAAYVLAMGVVLVYTGEHYVVDVVAGWLVAAVAITAAARAGAVVASRRVAREAPPPA
ncbi:phosphatase PAP2 family protein [Nocardioides hwasunensis]|uniref:Inositol phosphorylceramide synthase n=1 Tax=Nocardioides hwasunensis TaxID=397258 RepID=A0ABR8MC65_9ACTN|nr:phosphatase PAP2 family protein [Nocardioides hwasunensis]MBD3913517.1 inositol phosphorylceramide synthase [Nocardioides hwasunensis]